MRSCYLELEYTFKHWSVSISQIEYILLNEKQPKCFIICKQSNATIYPDTQNIINPFPYKNIMKLLNQNVNIYM